MQKLFFLGLFSCFCLTAFSQNHLRFGIRAGVNTSNMTFSGASAESFNQYKKNLNGGLVGIAAEIPLVGRLGLRTGIDLVTKGFGIDYSALGLQYSGTSRPIYVQIPVELAYNGRLLYFGIGPYLGFGVAGQYQSKTSGTGTNPFNINLTDEGDLKFGTSDKDDYKPGETGIVVEAGLKISILRIGIMYAGGLSNVVPDHTGYDLQGKTGMLGLTAGLMFGL